MEIVITEKKVSVDDGSSVTIDHLGNCSYTKTSNPDILLLTFSSGKEKKLLVSKTRVNGRQMTASNIDLLLSDLFTDSSEDTTGSNNGTADPHTAPFTQAAWSDPLVFPEPLRSGHIVEFYKEDSLQETYLYNGLSWDPLSAESNQRDFLSAGRADSLQLWYNAVLALEPVLKVKYNALRADTYISRSDKSILSNYGQPLQSAWGRLKAKIESALSSTSLSEDLYLEIKTEYSKVVTPLNYYLTKEYEVEKRTLSRGLLNPFSTQGKLTAGAKVEIYPSEYTFRLFKNTNDAYMTFSLISRVGDRRLLLTTGRNGSCERKEIRVSASTYSVLWSDLGKDTGDCIQVSAFDKDSYASFWIDLFVSYDTQADNADIYAISCRWASVI